MEQEKKKMAPKKDVKKNNGKNTEFGTPPNKIEVNPEIETRLAEAAKGKPAVITFGRMNPPTVGHQKLVDKVLSVAKQSNGMPHVYLSQSQNSKKDPLDYETKIEIAKKAFGSVVTKSNSKTIIEVMKELERMGHTDVTLVVGSDRVKEFETLLNKYNNKDYNFVSINVVSAGERDPDAEGVSGMSASKMRAAAADEDFASFKRGLPKRLLNRAQYVYDAVRAGMELAEELEKIDNELVEDLLDEKTLTLQQRRKRGLVMRRYKSKIARAKERAARRLATPEKLKTRARRHAIDIVRKRFAGQKGAQYKSLSTGEKIQIDKRIEKKRALIDKIAKKLLPKERKAEVERLKQRKISQQKEEYEAPLGYNEEFEAFLDEGVMTPQWLHDLTMAPKMKKMLRMYLNWRKQNPGQGNKGVQQVIKMMGLPPRDGNLLVDYLNKMVKQGKMPKHLAITEEDGNVDRAKEKHKTEKERLKRKHDSEMDRARLRDTRAANMAEEALFDTVDALMEFINHENAFLLTEKSRSALKNKAEKSGVPYSTLKKVYDRGVSEWTGTESKMTAEQAGYALVNKFIAEGGLWDNIHKKRERIKKGSGERMRKPGSKGAPTAQNFKDASEEGGAGDEGTDKLVRRYKKDTPMNEQTDLNESFEGMFGGTWARVAPTATQIGDYWDRGGLYHDHESVEEIDNDEETLEEAEHQGKKVTLNKPFRTPGGPKKFAVYTKNDKGNVVKVTFGDPNMEIKKDDPERRKSFRARHNCDDPGPKWKARYWSCKNW